MTGKRRFARLALATGDGYANRDYVVGEEIIADRIRFESVPSRAAARSSGNACLYPELNLSGIRRHPANLRSSTHLSRVNTSDCGEDSNRR